MNFLLLCIQSVVCVACVMGVKRFKVVQVRDFDIQDAKTWYPISLLLVTVIYTGSKSLVRVLPDTRVTIIRIHWIAISEYTRLYNLQEPHHHINRGWSGLVRVLPIETQISGIWRSHLVRR